MKKFVNDVETLLPESLSGLAAAHADIVKVSFDPTFVMRAHPVAGKVALVSGGGSGHEPLHVGYVGRGMLDAACPGQIFTAPTPDQIVAGAHAVDGGKGVLFIVKNYSGDTRNFQMADDMLDLEHATVLIDDDVAVESSMRSSGRRGVAGTLVVEKMVGAAAEDGADLRACKALGDRVNRSTASMGVALASCIVPTTALPTFEIGADEVEMGVGIHGEPGRRREKYKPADAIVQDLVAAILADLRPAQGAECLLHVNGLGGTPLMELYLLYHGARKRLHADGFKVARSLVGNYTTSLDMAGASITVTVLDDELKRLWDAPVHTAALRW